MDIATESGVTVERITSEKALSGVEEDWNRLTAKSEDPNVFMTFEWFQAWNHRFTQDDHEGRRRLCVLALK